MSVGPASNNEVPYLVAGPSGNWDYLYREIGSEFKKTLKKTLDGVMG
jgi:hypothetical protein